MIVTLMRHYKVNYSWKASYTPEEYRNAMREYDTADILDQSEVFTEDYQQIIISALPRTRATLKYLKGDAKYISTALLDEVSMEPFSDIPKQYSLMRLNVMARVQWMLNSTRQVETRKASIERARTFIRDYLNTNENCLIIGHGFFLRILSREMLKYGFTGNPIGYIKNGEKASFHRETVMAKDKLNEENV
jgi:broad specificity phosphatase PhoE